MAAWKLIFINIFISYLVCCSSDHNVPVLMWTNKENVRYPVLLRGQALGSKDFSNGYLEQIIEKNDQNFIVFIQDKLSLSDITNYADVFNEHTDGAAFSSTKKIMENYESTHIAKVSKPVDALKSLQRKFKGKIHIVDDTNDIDKVTLEDDLPNMIVISLPVTQKMYKMASLKQSDDIIGRMTKVLSGAKRRFSAVYTAYKSSEVSSEHGIFGGRHLLASPEENAPPATNTTDYTFFNISSTNSTKGENSSACIFFYATSIKFQVIQLTRNSPNYDNHTIYEFPALQKETSNMTKGSTCGNGTAMVMIDFGKNPVQGLNEFKMAMHFTSMGGFWSIETWNITFDGHNISAPSQTFKQTNWGMDAKNSTLYGTIPYGNPTSKGYSYHCGEEMIYQRNSTVLANADLVVRLRMTEFQLQFNVTNNTFGPPNECVGFFTGGVWMTVIFFALMLAILTFGLVLIANITTMDRFDDPKGKTIQVNVSE